MTILESNICTIAEGMKSNEIESLISELQMIADRKYSEEENYIPSEVKYRLFDVDSSLARLSLYKQ